jgi:hypothetical protein
MGGGGICGSYVKFARGVVALSVLYSRIGYSYTGEGG